MKKMISAVLAAGLLALGSPAAAHADSATRQTVDVTAWDDIHGVALPELLGNATLVRRDNGISMTFQTSGLPAGEAVTIWWIIIDPVDGLVSGQFAAGHVIGGSGIASFAGSLAEGDTSGCFHPLFPCHGLSDARGQTVLLLARVHGPKDPGRVPVQIHTAEATHGDPGFADDLCNMDPFCQVQAALFAP